MTGSEVVGGFNNALSYLERLGRKNASSANLRLMSFSIHCKSEFAIYGFFYHSSIVRSIKASPIPVEATSPSRAGLGFKR